MNALLEHLYFGMGSSEKKKVHIGEEGKFSISLSISGVCC
jgi:hypothetical protein